ncbi:short-chain dehydrogenase [Colletotrichum asianum]|uniref:Short-chain dehydrogenase n=1 Tax=Colletotrichum asianum TaxID=702518 RepID=A0A8H3ZRM6_9PEZI|nr:short-chain dehydrogenase [Colletotrichum asianum]
MAIASRPPIGKQSLSSFLTQMYPPKPSFTRENIPDLSGKVYIVTGANSGVGKETGQLLYSKNAKVYVAARSETKANDAIAAIREAWPGSTGSLEFLHLDLSDLGNVRTAAQHFLAQEERLDALINNAAIQALKDTKGETKTAQGHEMHLGVNVLGPFLFTRLLTPILKATASKPGTGKGAVRVVWVSSMGTETIGEKSRGLSPDYVDYWPLMSPLERYGLSKAGNWLHGVEFARRHATDGIMSVPVNPGHLSSELYREAGFVFRAALKAMALYPPVYGAYVELFGAVSSDLTMKDSGSWVVPWGRLYPIREDLLEATRPEEKGGNGHAAKFWDWSEEQVKGFL